MNFSTKSRVLDNLPTSTTSFIGRQRELAEGRRLLSSGRLATLTGVGGIGKTRLALRLASEVRRAFPDGVWLIDLASGNTESCLSAAARVLDFPDASDEHALSQYLDGKQLLLVLDGCESRIQECARLADHLLRRAPGVRILAASRQTLGIEGEHVLELLPLSAPEANVAVSDIDVGRYEALILFADRASALVPGFTVNARNRGAIAKVCRQLDGIPLAIELAAARIPVLSVEDLLNRVDNRFDLLRRECPLVTPSQRTLRSLVDRSYELCSSEERILWERLSVFSGGCDLEAAEHVCAGGGLDVTSVLDAAAGLVDKSIIQRNFHTSQARYQLMETLRQYGRERLSQSGEEQELRRRHRDWCRGLVIRAEAEGFGEHQSKWIDLISNEYANICAALEFCFSEPDEESTAPQITTSMWGQPLLVGSLTEARHWLERTLAVAPHPSTERAKALWIDAWLCLLTDDRASALSRLRECRILANRLRDEDQLASAVQMTGFAALLNDDFTRAASLLGAALRRHRAAGNRARAWTALLQLAVTAVLNDDVRSTELCDECLSMCEPDDDGWSRSSALWVAGLDRWRHGDFQPAAALVKDGLRTVARNNRLTMAQCLEALAWISAESGEDAHAAELLGVAQTAWQSTGTLTPALRNLAGAHERCRSQVQGALGSRRFAVAHARGEQMAPDQAIRLALDESSSVEVQHADPQPDIIDTLTPREREIAELVARGMSNRQIADALIIAQRTAEGHVESILRKEGFSSRTQIASAWTAAQQDRDRGLPSEVRTP